MAGGFAPPEGALCYEAGTLKNIFGMNIFEQVYRAPLRREGAVFRLECLLLADDRETMLIYTQDGDRMAVTITLPFITAVQARLFSRMIARARRVGASPAVPARVRRKREIAGKTRGRGR
jgi:hypothetical protein